MSSLNGNSNVTVVRLSPSPPPPLIQPKASCRNSSSPPPPPLVQPRVSCRNSSSLRAATLQNDVETNSSSSSSSDSSTTRGRRRFRRRRREQPNTNYKNTIGGGLQNQHKSTSLSSSVSPHNYNHNKNHNSPVAAKILLPLHHEQHQQRIDWTAHLAITDVEIIVKNRHCHRGVRTTATAPTSLESNVVTAFICSLLSRSNMDEDNDDSISSISTLGFDEYVR